jgi:hypothetical protein
LSQGQQLLLFFNKGQKKKKKTDRCPVLFLIWFLTLQLYRLVYVSFWPWWITAEPFEIILHFRGSPERGRTASDQIKLIN